MVKPPRAANIRHRNDKQKDNSPDKIPALSTSPRQSCSVLHPSQSKLALAADVSTRDLSSRRVASTASHQHKSTQSPTAHPVHLLQELAVALTILTTKCVSCLHRHQPINFRLPSSGPVEVTKAATVVVNPTHHLLM